ncbi:MAG: prepilin-type N-terminal cleavage/methylation domain-containing protein [Deltaproteobacteria bacterium]|nr:prepilin-type N-terminal cleavage/methylation domain-containing protein [Deltaproteobacteria bacterium]
MSASRRGFTLVEMMVAVAVGAISVVVAANVAGVVIRQKAKAKEVTDLTNRARLVARQIREDLRVAGYGSTGAIAVDPLQWPSVNTPTAGYPAMPAVLGLNGPAGDSDAVQLVVPDLGSVRQVALQLAGPAALFAGANLIGLGVLACPTGVAYVVDHTSPTGAGRTQVFQINPATGAALDNLQFDIAAGSEVMCARVSTYWVEIPPAPATPTLRRSDWRPLDGPVAMGPLRRLAPAANAADIVAPGILNMQVAYRMSAEAFIDAGVPIGAGVTGWAYEAAGDFGGNLNLPGPGLNSPVTPRWFEVRQVRINLLARTMRKMQVANGNRNVNLREDQVANTIPLLRDLRADWVTASEALINLRYFDLGAPPGVDAEPY